MQQKMTQEELHVEVIQGDKPEQDSSWIRQNPFNRKEGSTHAGLMIPQ